MAASWFTLARAIRPATNSRSVRSAFRRARRRGCAVGIPRGRARARAARVDPQHVVAQRVATTSLVCPGCEREGRRLQLRRAAGRARTSPMSPPFGASGPARHGLGQGLEASGPSAAAAARRALRWTSAPGSGAARPSPAPRTRRGVPATVRVDLRLVDLHAPSGRPRASSCCTASCSSSGRRLRRQQPAGARLQDQHPLLEEGGRAARPHVGRRAPRPAPPSRSGSARSRCAARPGPRGAGSRDRSAGSDSHGGDQQSEEQRAGARRAAASGGGQQTDYRAGRGRAPRASALQRAQRARPGPPGGRRRRGKGTRRTPWGDRLAPGSDRTRATSASAARRASPGPKRRWRAPPARSTWTTPSASARSRSAA